MIQEFLAVLLFVAAIWYLSKKWGSVFAARPSRQGCGTCGCSKSPGNVQQK